MASRVARIGGRACLYAGLIGLAASGAALPVSAEQREALFRQFIEWKRARGH
jgi:hypothetical protein